MHTTWTNEFKRSNWDRVAVALSPEWCHTAIQAASYWSNVQAPSSVGLARQNPPNCPPRLLGSSAPRLLTTTWLFLPTFSSAWHVGRYARASSTSRMLHFSHQQGKLVDFDLFYKTRNQSTTKKTEKIDSTLHRLCVVYEIYQKVYVPPSLCQFYKWRAFPFSCKSLSRDQMLCGDAGYRSPGPLFP